MTPLRFPSALLPVVTSLLLAALTIGFVVFRPMPANFFRYLIWRLTSPVQISHGSVAAGEARIHYACYGNGPAVMLLHGGLSNRLSWFSQLPWLVESGRQVVVLDTRGHGDSTLGSAELTYRLLAADAVAVLDHLR